MGNHLINSKAPELAKNGPPFTHTFIFGAYDGHHLPGADDHPRLSRQQSQHVCRYQAAGGVEAAGSYPTKYCVRHLDRVGSSRFHSRALSASGEMTSECTRLSRYGLLAVTGADARTFLHAQLTNDIANLPSDHAAPAGWCTAKGRLLASMLVIPRAEGFLLHQLAKDLAPAIAGGCPCTCCAPR